MKKLSLIAVLVLLAYSCRKTGEDPAPSTPQVVDDVEMRLITAFPWVAYKVSLSGVNIWDLGMIESCMKDDTYKFHKDSTFTQFENSNVCAGSEDSTQHDWMFYQGRKKIIGTFFGVRDTGEIMLLDTANFQVQVDYEGAPATLFFKKSK